MAHWYGLCVELYMGLMANSLFRVYPMLYHQWQYCQNLCAPAPQMWNAHGCGIPHLGKYGPVRRCLQCAGTLQLQVSGSCSMLHGMVPHGCD
jgi:hypothetical protein